MYDIEIFHSNKSSSEDDNKDFLLALKPKYR